MPHTKSYMSPFHSTYSMILYMLTVYPAFWLVRMTCMVYCNETALVSRYRGLDSVCRVGWWIFKDSENLKINPGISNHSLPSNFTLNLHSHRHSPLLYLFTFTFKPHFLSSRYSINLTLHSSHSIRYLDDLLNHPLILIFTWRYVKLYPSSFL